jgi:hypothetical protein
MIKYSLVFAFIILHAGCQSGEIRITEVIHQDLPHFKVSTPSAIYLINRESGGASSIIDTEGIDWINHSKKFEGKETNGADSYYRGLPNFVHREPGNGIGHPAGISLCNTMKKAEDQLYVTSVNGLWEFSWLFKSDYAVLTVHKTDTSRNYWFLYEGPVAGKFCPQSHYWANDVDGIQRQMPDIMTNPLTGEWQWAYFGDDSSERCFYVSMAEKDTLTDFFAYMGNTREQGIESDDGMAVFGFGRSRDTNPLLNKKNSFILGFYQRKLNNVHGYNEFSEHIQVKINEYKN